MNIDAEALSEVDVIIDMMPEKEKFKIPNSFKSFIKSKKSSSYTPNIKKDIPLYKQELKNDTKTICSLMYRSYLCTKEEKIRLAEQDKQSMLKKEEELREKYNPDNIFKINRSVEEIVEEQTTEMIEYKEKKWYRKLFDKIISFFRR